MELKLPWRWQTYWHHDDGDEVVMTMALTMMMTMMMTTITLQGPKGGRASKWRGCSRACTHRCSGSQSDHHQDEEDYEDGDPNDGDGHLEHK